MNILIPVLGITASILLFPSVSNLAVFAKGEFAYLESIGIILAYLTFSLMVYTIISKKLSIKPIGKLFIKRALTLFVMGPYILSLILVITLVWIRYDVKTQCSNAMRDYGDNCVNALSHQLMDKTQSYRSRNAAIWALGQLADKQALPALRNMYTGEIPPQESLDKTISQYELKKAIKWCEEGNSTSWMY